MELSIVIPVYNEEKIIGKSLRELIDFLQTNYLNNFEVIVVNDGSTDKTREIVENFVSAHLSLISYESNAGKGAALKKGVVNAKGKYIYIADADFSTPVEEISRFRELIGDFDCVIGSRAEKGAKEKSSKPRILAGKLGNLLINLLLNLDIKDTQCGFKMFKSKLKKTFVSCKTDGFGYDFEFLLKAEKAGVTIKEIPVKWIAGSKSSVGLRSYLQTLWELLKIWWGEVGLSKIFFKSLYKNTRTFRVYVLVGIFTNLMNVGIFFYLLHINTIQDQELLDFSIPHYVIIETIAYVISVLFNFVLHKFFTFKSNSWKFKELTRYIIMLGINYLASVTLLYIMIDLLGYSEPASKIISLVLVIMWNFFALKYFVYKTKEF